MDQNYHIGDLVTLSRDRTAGAGRVVAADTLFGQTYLEVYFPATGQVVRRPADDFEPWGDLFDRLAAGQVAPASAFLARLIARQIAIDNQHEMKMTGGAHAQNPLSPRWCVGEATGHPVNSIINGTPRWARSGSASQGEQINCLPTLPGLTFRFAP